MNNQKILIIGGTGYIGTPLVKKLMSNHYDITLLVREKSSFRDEFRGCKYFVGDLLDKESLLKNINNFDLVIDLAAVIRTINKKRYQENIIGVKNLIDVLKTKIIQRIIYFSTQSVNLKNKGPYSKSKEISEELIRESGLNYIIIRPNYVYGIDKTNDFYRMASFISKFRIVPIIGNGNYKIQPIFKDDLVNIVFGSVDNFKSRSIIEISGKETISINEIAKLIGESLKIKPLTLHIPVAILQLFKIFIPFDVDGYIEDRISQNPFRNYNFSSFKENLKKILKLLK